SKISNTKSKLSSIFSRLPEWPSVDFDILNVVTSASKRSKVTRPHSTKNRFLYIYRNNAGKAPSVPGSKLKIEPGLAPGVFTKVGALPKHYPSKKATDVPAVAIHVVSTSDPKPPVIFSGVSKRNLEEHCDIRIHGGAITLYDMSVRAVARILDWINHGSKRFNEGELDDKIALQVAADALQLKCIADGAIIRQILRRLRDETPTAKQLEMMSECGGWDWCARLDLHGHSAAPCGCFMKEVMEIVVAAETEGKEHETLQDLLKTDKELRRLYAGLGGKLMAR
ncbi:hypothetical protein LTS18_013900, partial [Coniosporium uncinatum]